MLSLTEKLFLRLFLRFKTLENGEKMKQKCQKQVPQNAVLVKKHNKMIGKKWILNMDFLRIWETGAYKNKIF